MKKVILSKIALILGVIVFFSPALAQQGQCINPPVLQNPRTCTISTSGGSCSFGSDEDGIVSFPNQIVTGQVTISGGRTIHLIGGHIQLFDGARYAVAFNSPKKVFVEGMHVDSNGYCDIFAVRNQDGIQTDFTFQNIFAEGPAYNIVDGNCHGDLIQNQGEGVSGGLNLHVENFYGVTDAQGFFIPHRSSGTASADLRNVYIVRETNANWKPLLWVSTEKYGDPAYPVTLDNVWVDVNPGGTQVYPTVGAVTNGQMSFPADTLIDGVVNIGRTNVNFEPYVGLNYDRSHFCPDPVSELEPAPEPAPEPTPEPAPAPEPSPDLTQEDTAAPSVQFASPSDGGSVQRRSKAIITFNAADDVAVSDVELRIGGRRVARFAGPGPYSYEWRVRFRMGDNVTISAQATDMSGNRGEASVLVKVAE